MSELSKALKRFREQYKITQKKAASVAGITERNYQKYEYDKVVPSATALISLANYFGVSLDYLVGRTNEPHGQATGTPSTAENQLIKQYRSLTPKSQETVNSLIANLAELEKVNTPINKEEQAGHINVTVNKILDKSLQNMSLEEAIAYADEMKAQTATLAAYGGNFEEIKLDKPKLPKSDKNKK